MAKYSGYVEISTFAKQKEATIAKQPRTLRLQLHRLVVGWFRLLELYFRAKNTVLQRISNGNAKMTRMRVGNLENHQNFDFIQAPTNPQRRPRRGPLTRNVVRACLPNPQHGLLKGLPLNQK